MKPGDMVVFWKMPDWVDRLPKESQRVFKACLGKTLRIDEIDANGLFILDVSLAIDKRFGGFMNDIRLEAEYLKLK